MRKGGERCDQKRADGGSSRRLATGPELPEVEVYEVTEQDERLQRILQPRFGEPGHWAFPPRKAKATK